MRILIATVRIPFVLGGAEVLAGGLRDALAAAGHRVEIASIPFKAYPPERILDQMLACRLMNFGTATADLFIGLKFPAYLARHPRKVIWMIHQHRQAYDLWQHPLGDLHQDPAGGQVRAAIHTADRALLGGCRLLAISQNVALRMATYSGLEAAALYHPPHDAHLYHTAPAEDFLYFPSRINPLKRQALVLDAVMQARLPVRVWFSGPAGDPAFERRLAELSAKDAFRDRVRWLGSVSEDEKRGLYARCLGVVFPPVDEDYGYITLEAMLARKPVITCRDSGGPLEFVAHHVTGIVAEPDPHSLASAMDDLWANRERARRWGEAGRQRYEDLHIGWKNVLEQLLP